MHNFQTICLMAKQVVEQTAQFIALKNKNRHTSGISIESKGLNNFVTDVDKQSEMMLVEGLSKILPDAGFITEEETSTITNKQFTWIIDPLDGTTNFIHGAPPFAISVALNNGNQTVVGIVHEVMANECFYTWQGGESYCNGEVIHVSQIREVRDSLIVTGFPYRDFGKMPDFLASLDYFMRNTHGMRRLGSAATDLAYVACGRFEAFYEYGLAPWDVAAGALLVQNAGGNVGDFEGNNNYIFGHEIIATNKFIHSDFSRIVAEFLT